MGGIPGFCKGNPGFQQKLACDPLNTLVADCSAGNARKTKKLCRTPRFGMEKMQGRYCLFCSPKGGKCVVSDNQKVVRANRKTGGFKDVCEEACRVEEGKCKPRSGLPK